jgi:hypothetical protein
MIVRYYIKCATCGSPHTLRLQVCGEPYQEHTFRCANCVEDIVIGLKFDQIKVTVDILEIENAAKGSEEGNIVNLSSEFPYKPEDLNSDLVFPSTEYALTFLDTYKKLNIRPQTFSSLEKAKNEELLVKSINGNWPFIKKGWSLVNKGKIDLSKEQLKKYSLSSLSGQYDINFLKMRPNI